MAISRRWLSVAAVLILLLDSDPTHAQALRVRVSVKIILDENGNRPNEGVYYQDSQIAESVRVANGILEFNGANWRLDLVEIVDLDGVSQWIGGSVCDTQSIEGAATSNPALYAWREDAINVYVTDKKTFCAAQSSGLTIVINNAWAEIWPNYQPPPYNFADPSFENGEQLLHEIGHFFKLRHTHGVGVVCSSPAGETDERGPVADDGIEDTLPDLDCWSRDAIARWSFHADYADLRAEKQKQVDDTYFNLMSYHFPGIFTENKAYLTRGQLEIIAADMHPVTGRRTHVLNTRLPNPKFTWSPGVPSEAGDVQVDARTSTTEPGHEIVTYAWDFGDGSDSIGPSDQLAMASHHYTAPGRYTIRLTVTDDRGLWMISEQRVAVRLSGVVPPPWTAQDIGAVSGPGGARTLEDGCVLVQGADGTISGSRDRFHYVAQRHNGNFSLVGRIASWQNVSVRFAKVGLMVREGLDEGARHGAVFLELPTFSAETFRHRFLSRSITDGQTGSAIGDPYQSPELWLRIDRIGDTIQGFASDDGISWGEPDTVTLEKLADEVHVGIAASGQPPLGLWSVATICDISIDELRSHFLRGDCNGDRKLDISDGVSNLNFLFAKGEESDCVEACNTNDDDKNDIADAVAVFNFLFGSGAPPDVPFPACGEDPDSAASLGCGRFGCE